MKKVLIAATAAGILVSGSVLAGKVNMPREGTYELKFCTIGDGTVVLANDQAYVSHYQGTAVLNSVTPGGPFDRQGASCFGTLGIVDGKARHFGYCIVADEDGDKWLLEYQGKQDNSGGTYTAPWGTGKYEGMMLKGEYKLDFYPVISATGYAGCHHNKGTYRLK